MYWKVVTTHSCGHEIERQVICPDGCSESQREDEQMTPRIDPVKKEIQEI
jgi:hypothetical protein